MNYEEKMKRLTEITSRLENEQLSLEEASKLYAEGMQISAECHKILQDAVLNVQTIQGQNSGSEVTTQ
ncbi:MAG TPA: exodeoxyribonuclease VII small subunit [Ruminococcus sp.]|jgi:exodeoxyribonuclease VII small subunit|nr:exodeoxyribonuclease VII small subunit [Ruminococcus sp.]